MAITMRLLCALLILCGCDRGNENARGLPPQQPGEIRIVSLSPAMTSTLQQVGLGPHLVGRSAFCRDVDHLPVAGDLDRTNVECLVRLRPTHVFAQGHERGGHVDLRGLAKKHGWTLAIHPLVDIDDVQQFLLRIGTLLPQTKAPCEGLRQDLQLAMRPRSLPQPTSVLIVSPGASPLAWGSDTYLGQLAVAAGLENLAMSPQWQALSLEDVSRLNADLVLVPVDGDVPDFGALATAVPQDRFRVLAHPGIDLPGPHLAKVSRAIDEIAQSFHRDTDAP